MVMRASLALCCLSFALAGCRPPPADPPPDVAGPILCREGFERSGDTCVDVDECGRGLLDCGPRGRCVNSAGSARCVCTRGWVFSNGACRDIDECLQWACGGDVECRNEEGSFECVCAAGFAYRDGDCRDVDECEAHPCGPGEACVNTTGAFACHCADGYEPVDGACVDVDECLARPCHPLATCVNRPGSFQCSCPRGYERVGLACVDVDECRQGLRSCPAIQRCVNTPGSSFCECREPLTPEGACVPPDPVVCLEGLHAAAAPITRLSRYRVATSDLEGGFVVLDEIAGTTVLRRLTWEGAEIWAKSLGGARSPYEAGAEPDHAIVHAAGDRVLLSLTGVACGVATTATLLVLYDAAQDTLWARSFPPYTLATVDTNGDVVVLTRGLDLEPDALVTIGPDGATRAIADVRGTPIAAWPFASLEGEFLQLAPWDLEGGVSATRLVRRTPSGAISSREIPLRGYAWGPPEVSIDGTLRAMLGTAIVKISREGEVLESVEPGAFQLWVRTPDEAVVVVEETHDPTDYYSDCETHLGSTRVDVRRYVGGALLASADDEWEPEQRVLAYSATATSLHVLLDPMEVAQVLAFRRVGPSQ